MEVGVEGFKPGLIEAYVQKTRMCFPFGSVCLDSHSTQKTPPRPGPKQASTVSVFMASLFHAFTQYYINFTHLCVCGSPPSGVKTTDGASHLLVLELCCCFCCRCHDIVPQCKACDSVDAKRTLRSGLLYNNLPWNSWAKCANWFGTQTVSRCDAALQATSGTKTDHQNSKWTSECIWSQFCCIVFISALLLVAFTASTCYRLSCRACWRAHWSCFLHNWLLALFHDAETQAEPHHRWCIQ